MLSKVELKRIAYERLADAEALCQANRFDGAVYLCGYVVEIMLKLRICKTLRWDGFPETRKEFEGLSNFKTHDFDMLLHLSGVEEKIKNNFLIEWSTVKTWNPEFRYNRVNLLNSTERKSRKVEVQETLDATRKLISVL